MRKNRLLCRSTNRLCAEDNRLKWDERKGWEGGGGRERSFLPAHGVGPVSGRCCFHPNACVKATGQVEPRSRAVKAPRRHVGGTRSPDVTGRWVQPCEGKEPSSTETWCCWVGKGRETVLTTQWNTHVRRKQGPRSEDRLTSSNVGLDRTRPEPACVKC